MPKISVVIPCHNAGSYIGTTLKSVQAQTVASHEIVVINDSSTDDTAQVLESFSDCISVISSDAGNGATARNLGVQQATGNWIAFLDADDIWYPEHLERVAIAIKSGDKSFANCFDHLRNDSEAITANPLPACWTTLEQTGLTGIDFIEQYHSSPWFPGMSGLAFERAALMQAGGLDDSQIRRHDIELWIRFLADPSNTWTLDAQPSSAYRIDTPNALSRNMTSKEYFMFKAFKLNQHHYHHPTYAKLLKRYARRCIASALTHGDSKDIEAAYQLSGRDLSTLDRLAFAFGRIFPKLLPALIRMKRTFSNPKVNS